eukprot:c1957_g1_i1.p2 GENE.c1957_g1_i1~~c1957_g1_i1.p2  ORF type:complete len:119 (-),score=19.93 c1957_g1_i1:63-419(-)
MVLNCVPTPTRRGDMLRKAITHLDDGGLLFLMLPRRCVQESRHFDHDALIQAASFLGAELVSTKESPKILFYCFRKQTATPPKPRSIPQQLLPPPQKLKEFTPREWKKRNDFAVCFES